MVILNLSLLFFITEWNCFIFLCVCWFSPPLYPFNTITENTVFNMNSPEGFLAVVSIDIIRYFISFPSPSFRHLKLHPANPYDNPKTPVLHFRLYFWPYIWLLLSVLEVVINYKQGIELFSPWQNGSQFYHQTIFAETSHAGFLGTISISNNLLLKPVVPSFGLENQITARCQKPLKRAYFK